MTITGTYEGTQNEMKPYTLQSKKVKNIYPMSRIQHFVLLFCFSQCWETSKDPW